MAIERLLTELKDSKRKLVTSHLTQLSALDPAGLEQLQSIWGDLPLQRRRLIVEELAMLAEDNVDLDFSEVYRFCLQDTDAEVRQAAVGGLWDNTDRTFIRPFISLLNHDPSEEVRIAAAKTLAKYAVLASLGKLLPKDTDEVSEALFWAAQVERNPSVKQRLIEAIGVFTDPRVKPLIDQAYASDDIETRASALYAMGMSCDPAWLPTVLQELLSEHLRLRFEAVNAAGGIGDEQAVPHLIPLASEGDREVQFAAIDALGAIGGAEAKNALLRLMQSDDDEVQNAAEQALSVAQTTENTFALDR